MKRKALILVILIAAAAALGAQEYDQKFLKNQGLTEDQIARLTEVQDKYREEIQKARADSNVLKARLAQLLVGANVDMGQVEKTVKEAADLDVKIKLAQIRQEIALRKLLGDKRWAEITRALRQRKAAVEEKANTGDKQTAAAQMPRSTAAEAKAAEEKVAGRNLSKEQREKALELLKELRQLLGETQQ